MEIVPSHIDKANNSARRMYYPKEYHYVQEIQKFNVADYRPRYPLPWACLTVEWNNSKKQSVKSVKYSVCANNAATHSLRETRDKCDLFVRTIQLNIAASMEK